MIYLYCYFDYRRGKHYPQYACSYNSKSKKIEFYPLYYKGHSISLETAYKNEQKIRKLFEGPVTLSGFKPFIKSFRLDPIKEYEVYDVPLELEPTPDIGSIKKALVKRISVLKQEPQLWQSVLSKAQLVYQTLEDRGYYHNDRRKHPIYDFVYTGRSKCIQNNIQGATANDIINHVDPELDIFVHFDWVAADFRVASLISQDKTLEESFLTSDPYTRLYEELGDPEITRDKCKLELFKSFYSMNADAAPLEFYPEFAEWMKISAAKIEEQGFSESLLGRRFKMGGERTVLSAFNAQVQGTVAHAMQNVIWQVHQQYPDLILTEVHDALIMCAKSKDVKNIIKRVGEVMLHPLDGISEVIAKFPVKVSLGTKWKKWKLFKEFR